MIDPPDNVALGLAQLPQGLRDADTDKFLGIYLERQDELQAIPIAQINDLLSWYLLTADTPAYMLAWVGKVLGQPRPDDVTDREYKRILLLRRAVRTSSGTQPQVREAVQSLGTLGGGASVVFMIPHTVVVTFGNFTQVASQGVSLATAIDLLADAIGSVDRLQLWDAVGNPFAWDIQGQGWLQGVWASKLYDSKD